ncbi:MAG: beta-lactamase family protein, partial [Planctomycetes bacterium]|nr:beta-lactamase family protein [Planctomycetota bacterium]
MQIIRLAMLLFFFIIGVNAESAQPKPREKGKDASKVQRTELPRKACAMRIPPLDFSGTSGRDTLDDFIQNVMAVKHIPGLSAAVSKNNRVIWQGQYGNASFEPEVFVSEDTL